MTTTERGARSLDVRGPADEDGPYLSAGGLRLVLGYVLRRRRCDLGMSQRDLAAECGLSPAVVGRLEAGSSSVSVTTAQRALVAVGLQLVPVDVTGRVWLGDRALEDDVLDLRDRAGRRHPPHLAATRGSMPLWGFLRAQREGRLRDTTGPFRGYTYRGRPSTEGRNPDRPPRVGVRLT